ncbi:MAG: hypothetical protein M5R41_17770 [Bacteroidia bacterium]|nr:hypothetical protein [Bacteroidia bacterium]
MAAIKCYKIGTERECTKWIYETEFATVLTDPKRKFGVYPPIYCLKGIDGDASEEEVILNIKRLKSLGFSYVGLGLEEYYDYNRNTVTSLGKALEKAGYETENLQLHTHCGSHDIREIWKVKGAVNILPPGRHFDSIYIDEPLRNKNQCNLDIVAVRAFANEVYKLGEKFITSDFYLGIGSDPTNFDDLSSFSDGLAYSRYTRNWGSEELTSDFARLLINPLSLPGTLLYRFCYSNPKACLQIHDWYQWRADFKDKNLTGWINVACHPDHYTWHTPCNKDYFDTLLCEARKIGLDNVMLFGAYDIDVEIAHQIRSMFLPRPIGSFPDPEISKYLPEILVCLQKLKMTPWGLLDEFADGVYNANVLHDNCSAYRKLICDVFWRRAQQYSAAATRCGWIKSTSISTGKVIKTLYCISSGGEITNGKEIIDCANCTEWSEMKPNITVCGVSKRKPEINDKE